MTVIKVKTQKDYTIISNSVLENPNLSFKAKGLWAYCMSRPDDWQFHINHLVTVSKEKKSAVYSALKELQEAGLVVRHQTNDGGKFGAVDYIIYPSPQELKKCLPHSDFPQTENPYTENQPLLSKEDIQKKDYITNVPPPSEDGVRLLKIFIASLKENLPSITHMPEVKAAKEFDKLLEEFSFDEIVEVINFCHKDDFWKDKTFKPSQLVYGKNKERNRFGQLQLAMKRGNPNAKKSKNPVAGSENPKSRDPRELVFDNTQA